MRRNREIKASEVRVIDVSGENIGVKSLDEALKLAEEAGLDLIEVSANAIPPVCRVVDYNKYLYELKSKEKKTKTKKTNLKEFTLSPKIGEGDLNIRIRRGREFIEQGHVVRYTVKFKGRERVYPEIGETKLKIIESELSDVAKVEQPARMLGGEMSMTLMPGKKT